MKKLYHLFLFFIFLYFRNIAFLPAQSTPYWALAAGSTTAVDEALDVAVDANGNTYSTGYFIDAAKFGAFTLTSAGGVPDIFVVKINNQGIVQWAVKAGGYGVDKGMSIKADNQGNSYITGYFSGTATFGTTSLTSFGQQDIFIAKYNTSGVLQWVKQAGGKSNETGNGITVDNLGNVIITGQFTDTAKFDNITLISRMNAASLSSSIDVFTAKYNSAGNIVWAKKGSAPSTDRGIDVDCDPNGNVYITGQFTDTITFDATHNNNIYNAIFLVKYNSSGTEQWFRRIGGGSQNVAYGIAVDKNSNVFLTGDFLGNLTFYDTKNYLLTNAYTNHIFIAKYNTSGTLLWAKADGSDNDVSARNIALDANGDAYIIGNFKCKFSDYAGLYGQGTFNSIGYEDVFVTKYTSGGTREWARNIGGQDKDFGKGIALNAEGQVHIAGSFSKVASGSNLRMVFPGTNIYGTVPDNNSPNYGIEEYCSDGSYGMFCDLNGMSNADNNTDIYIAKAINLSRQPYDYYYRSGETCVRPFVGVCINNSGSDKICEENSLTICGSTTIHAATRTGGTPGYVGPVFAYKWSTGASTKSITVTNSGDYAVKLSTDDGCFTSSDTFHVTVNSFPAKPTISDSKGVNTNTTSPDEIAFCAPDSVKITAGNQGTNSYSWSGGKVDTKDPLSIWVKQTGNYKFTVTNNGCESSTEVDVSVTNPVTPPTIDPRIILLNDPDKNDSLSFCAGDKFTLLIYDTISNPAAGFNPEANKKDIPYSSTHWEIAPGADIAWNDYLPYDNFTPPVSGKYVVNARLTISPPNSCSGPSQVYYFSYTVYIERIPPPTVKVTISGEDSLCPGSTTTLTATATAKRAKKITYKWIGPGIVGPTDQSAATVNKPGRYIVTATVLDSNECTGSSKDTLNIVNLTPIFSISISGINSLCSGEITTLTATSGATSYKWSGPGIVGSDTVNPVTINTAGYYSVNATLDVNGCKGTGRANKNLNDPTITPAIPVIRMDPSNGLICPNGVITLTAPLNKISYEWYGPNGLLQGNSSTINVKDAKEGDYYCVVKDVRTCKGNIVDTMSRTSNTKYATQYATPSLTADDKPLCPGERTTISVSTNVGSTIKWLPPLSGSGLTQVITGGTTPGTTTYSCKITSCGITDTLSVSITQGGAKAQIIPKSPLHFCQGDSVVLGANPGMADYEWNPGKYHDYQLIVYQTKKNITVTTTDDNGCKATSSAVTTVMHDTAVIKTADKNICTGTSVTLTATSQYPTIQWFDSLSGGRLLSNGGNFTTPILTSAATYYIESGDSLCKTRKPVTVSIIPTSLTPVINSNSPLCEGDTLIISANVVNNATYTWTDPKGISPNKPLLIFPNADPSYSGTYSLVVSGNGCASPSASVAVTVYPTPKTPFLNNNEPVCEGKTLYLSSTPIANATYNWMGPDSFSSGLQNPSIATTTLDNDGTYSLTVTVNGCKNTAYTGVTIKPTPVITSQSNSPICEGETLELISSSSVADANYRWTGPHSFSSTLEDPVITNALPKHSGEYAVIATLNNCPSEVKKINAEVYPLPTANLGNDTIICMDSPITLHAENGAEYLWQDNSTDATYVVTKDGTYFVTATSDKGCFVSDAVTIKVVDCTFCVPPVITPNDDGVNDNLQLCNTVGVKFFHGEIFDRWGLKIYEWDDMYKSWDGTRQRTGKKVDDGVYYYIIQITDHKDHPKTHNGFIQVIR